MCPGQLIPSSGILRLRPHSIVAVDVCCPDPSLLVDNLAGRHRQSKVGLMSISPHFLRRWPSNRWPKISGRSRCSGSAR